MTTHQADVVIVGLGASGSILARELTAAGLRVLGIEKGPEYAPEDFWLKFDELRYSIRCGISPTMTTDPITWRANARSEAKVLPVGGWPRSGQPPLPAAVARRWGRFHPLCLLALAADGGRFPACARWCWSHFGEEVMPEDSRIVDWPVSYDELEPFYAQVEREIGVSGQAGNIDGTIVAGGNPFEAPRSGPYPFPPIRPSASNQPFVDACNDLGYHPFPVPTSIISEDWGERKGCVYCGFCRDYGCHVGAKSSTQDALIPAAQATGNLEVLANCRVQRVNVDADGRARSVTYVDASGEQHEASGDLIILAAYSLENVRLSSSPTSTPMARSASGTRSTTTTGSAAPAGRHDDLRRSRRRRLGHRRLQHHLLQIQRRQLPDGHPDHVSSPATLSRSRA